MLLGMGGGAVALVVLGVALVIAVAVDADLGLVHQAPERRAVHQSVPVPFPAGAQEIRGLGGHPACGAGALGVARHASSVGITLEN